MGICPRAVAPIFSLRFTGFNMESLIFAFGAVAPIIFTVALGYFLKKIGLLPLSLTKPINKLVFRVLLPCMLFLNVYNIGDFSSIDARYIIYAVVAVIVIFVLALPITLLVTKDNSMRGPMLQCSFRSNYALIGIPLAEALFGNEGIAVATLLSAVAIPLFNILAVVSLTVFGNGDGKASFKKVLLGIVKNPLIVGIAAGLLVLGVRTIFVNYDISFRLSDITPVYTVLDYLSRCATPLALLTLGIQFEFSTVAELKREIILGTVGRLVLVPVLFISIAYIFFDFRGEHFAAFVALYATPVAVSSVPMAQEMNADVRLAGQLVAWNTLFSGVTIFLYAFILKLLGVF